MSSAPGHQELRRLWGTRPHGAIDTDYALLEDLGRAYAAVCRTGAPALVVELSDLPALAVGRRAAGCDLVPHASLRFAHGGREWTAPAAALLCTDPDLLDAFTVLAADIHGRLVHRRSTWPSVVAIVEEWQALIAPRGRPSPEAQIGLWGELWLIASSTAPDTLVTGWRGPDRDAADFFLNGKAAEVKTSRQRRRHHVSLSQVTDPVGDNDAWLLSMWVGIDPIRGETVPSLVDGVLARVVDPAGAFRRIVAAGYSPADRGAYDVSLVLLAEPEWYPVAHVPRVRAADPGVSGLRYLVSLDETRRAASSDAAALWHHFLSSKYGTPA